MGSKPQESAYLCICSTGTVKNVPSCLGVSKSMDLEFKLSLLLSGQVAYEQDSFPSLALVISDIAMLVTYAVLSVLLAYFTQ